MKLKPEEIKRLESARAARDEIRIKIKNNKDLIESLRQNCEQLTAEIASQQENILSCNAGSVDAALEGMESLEKQEKRLEHIETMIERVEETIETLHRSLDDADKALLKEFIAIVTPYQTARSKELRNEVIAITESVRQWAPKIMELGVQYGVNRVGTSGTINLHVDYDTLRRSVVDY